MRVDVSRMLPFFSCFLSTLSRPVIQLARHNRRSSYSSIFN